MNPRSGGGKVGKLGLKEKAEALGAEVALLEGPGPVDVAALARRAVAGGADLLGVAGGDGTQALVAGIAAEHDLPFLVISAGTRNHFAIDLGLNRDDPAACLDALSGAGVEQRIDLGVIGGRTFVNNASFGAYAEVVQSPAYRDDKRGTTLQMLPTRVRVPRDRPGTRPPKPRVDWQTLRQLASFRAEEPARIPPARAPPQHHQPPAATGADRWPCHPARIRAPPQRSAPDQGKHNTRTQQPHTKNQGNRRLTHAFLRWFVAQHHRARRPTMTCGYLRAGCDPRELQSMAGFWPDVVLPTM